MVAERCLSATQDDATTSLSDPIQFSKYWRQSAESADWICPFDLTRPSQKSEIVLIAAFPVFEASNALACTKQAD
jgi:hypothetical protein